MITGTERYGIEIKNSRLPRLRATTGYSFRPGPIALPNELQRRIDLNVCLLSAGESISVGNYVWVLSVSSVPVFTQATNSIFLSNVDTNEGATRTLILSWR